MLVCSPAIQKYFDSLNAEFSKAFSIAETARKKGLDPVNFVEIAPAADVAARVEGLVGPPGVAARIRELIASGVKREAACYQLCKEIIDGKFPLQAPPARDKKEAAIEQAVRTGLALFTEGVVSAPIEGISKIKLRKNADDSECIAVYFAGPIRGAGGTGQAFTLVLADFCRQYAGIKEYRPTDDEVERFVEESNLYALKTRAGQYVPTDDEVRHIARSCPVCIDGEPTEDYEVSVHKNTFGVETNRVRGGMCLVLSEGLCLKAAKIMKITKNAGLDWSWIEKLVKVSKQEQSKVEIKPVAKYIDEIVAGRPIFGYPMRAGGFRLRYGRTRFTGIASKAIHPAAMAVLKNFPAIGTQVKLERPGKGCIVTPCSSLEGPIVRLKGGEVRQLNSLNEAISVADQVEQVLFLGDLLVNYGDFSKANHPLVPSAWCDEWYEKELAAKNVKKTRQEIAKMSWEESFKLAKEHGVPIAPKHTLYWHDLSCQQVKELAEWVCAAGKLVYEWFDFKELRIKNGKQKALLEFLGLPHKVQVIEGEETIVVEKDNALSLLVPLGLLQNKTLSLEKFSASFSPEKDVMQLVNELAGTTMKKKAGVYVGACMGRPEKAKERKMQPPVHALFPVGLHGGKGRDAVKAVKNLKAQAENSITVDTAVRVCPSCKTKNPSTKCRCGKNTVQARECPKCGKLSLEEKCRCGTLTRSHAEQQLDLVQEFEEARKTTGADPKEVKCVQGLISADKVFEPLAKGMLRAKHGVYVFRDGTCRYDATEVPVTHFTPREVGASIEKLKQLGYEKDCNGKPLEKDDQTIELFPQDIIISEQNAEYFLRLAAFVDDLLVYYYCLPPYYNAKKREDLIGRLVIAIAPHISAGIIGRIIGFTSVRGLLMHPYMHCATRRNADGDEDCLMLLMDALLNFSKKYLPSTRGGSVTADTQLPLVNPDDEIELLSASEFFERIRKTSSIEKEGDYEILSPRGWKTFVFDEQLKVTTKPVKEIIRYAYSGKLFKVQTRFKHEITITGDHSLFKLENGEIKSVKGSEIKKGDCLAAPKKIVFKPKKANSIDLATAVDPKELYVELTPSIRKKINEKWKSLPRGRTHLFKHGVSDLFSHQKMRYDLLEKIIGVNEKLEKLHKVGLRRCRHTMKRFVNVDEDLAWFLGMFVAEGSLAGSLPSVSNKDSRLVKKIVSKAKKIFGVKPSVRWGHKAYCVDLPRVTKILFEALGFRKEKTRRPWQKTIPSIILNSEEKLVKQFLAGFLAGDGSARKQKEIGETHSVAYTTSPKVAHGLALLFLRLGVIPCIEKRKRGGNRKDIFTVSVHGGKNNNQLTDAIRGQNSVTHRKSETVPLQTLLKQLRKSTKEVPRHLTKRPNVAVYSLKQLVEKLEKKQASTEEKKIVEALKKIVSGDVAFLPVQKIYSKTGKTTVYDLKVEGLPIFVGNWLFAHNSMDAPLVLTTLLDPTEVDDEVHAMDACKEYPLEFYHATERFASPSEVKLDTIATRLGKESQYEGIGFTHEATLEGPTQTRYVLFKNMRQKVEDELALMNCLRSVDAANAAERIILSHFFPDLYGNMHSFGKQGFRCVDCGAKFRRIPLRGKCTKCGGKIILTINKGGIEKYLELSKDMIDRYGLPLYMKQRIMLLEKEIASMFEDDKSKQFSLAQYF